VDALLFLRERKHGKPLRIVSKIFNTPRNQHNGRFPPTLSESHIQAIRRVMHSGRCGQWIQTQRRSTHNIAIRQC